MVAARVGGEPLALDVGQRAVEQDLAVGADVIAHAVEPVVVLVGEPARRAPPGALSRTFTTNSGAATIRSCRSAVWSTQTETSGGSSETEARLLAVMPGRLPPGSRTVRTVTPVAKRPSSWRKRAGSIGGRLRAASSRGTAG